MPIFHVIKVRGPVEPSESVEVAKIRSCKSHNRIIICQTLSVVIFGS